MALNYADKETGAFNMVFTFDHCWCNGLEGKEIITEADRHVDVRQLKQVFARWYDGLGERAWPAVYWMNHDLPRVVSQYGRADPLSPRVGFDAGSGAVVDEGDAVSLQRRGDRHD